MSIFANQIVARPARLILIISALALAGLPGMAMADDWVAEQLRGRVLVQTDGTWVALERGDVVSDTSPIQSMLSGRATFTRDNESITIDGGTIIQIVDRGSPGQSNTVVHQQMGTVIIEAEVQQVQHFSVETPFLAAVVKGTRFTVDVENDGAEVSVERGRVEVRDVATGVRVDITPGHKASNVGGGPLTVDGESIVASAAGNGSGSQSGGEGAGGGGIELGLGLGGGGSGGGVNLEVGAGGDGGGIEVDLDVGGSEDGGGIGVDVGVGGDGIEVGINIGGINLGLGLG